MKPINRSLLVAAVLSSALSALAQSPRGGAAPEPEAAPSESGASEVNPTPDRVRRNTIQDANSTGNPNTDTNDTYRSRPSRAGSADDMNPPQRKRSFWDRLFGRNKQLDAGASPRPNDVPARGVESRP